jgi:hypothetical protein
VLASFEQERDRFETMMNRNGGRVTDLVPASGKARKEAAANR